MKEIIKALEEVRRTCRNSYCEDCVYCKDDRCVICDVPCEWLLEKLEDKEKDSNE